MKVVVNQARCEGHAMCEALAPEVFELGEDGVARVLVQPIPEGLFEQARSGVRACPVAALDLEDG